MGRITDRHRQFRAERGALQNVSDIEGMLDAIDVEMGREFTRTMLKEFPDVERALSRGRINRAWAGLHDAVEAEAITQEQFDQLVTLAEEYGIPRPEEE